MKIKPDCLPCILRMALQTARLSGQDERGQKTILEKTIDLLDKITWNETPPEIAYRLHRIIRRLTGIQDPFKELKIKSTETALRLYPVMMKAVEESEDKLEAAVRISVAGNIIDFAAHDSPDLESTIREVFKKEFKINDYELFREKVLKSESLLFFLDNAGETVTDRILIETMLSVRRKPFEKITLVAKGGPIINDATVEDTLMAGLKNLPNAVFKTVSNGEEGTGPRPRDPEIDKWIEGHDLVISKGQGNYEVLNQKRGLFFILIAKCRPIAEALKVKIGDIIIKYNP